MQGRLEHAESKLKSQTERMEQMMSLHGQYKSKFGSMKHELQYYREENKILTSKALLIDEANDQIELLAKQNDFLENQVAKIFDMKKDKSEDEKFDFFERFRKKQADCEQLISERNELREEINKLQSRLSSVQSLRDIQTCSPRIISSPPANKVNAELERMAKKLAELQRQCDRTQRYYDQTNQLLESQITINDSLQHEIHEKSDNMMMQIFYLEIKVHDLSVKAAKRLQQIRLLESRTESGMEIPRVFPSEESSLIGIENYVEINVESAKILDASLEESVETIAVVDFHTFESQLSGLAVGKSPVYNLTSNYKVDVNRFFLESIRKQFIRIELYTLQHSGVSQLYAFALIPLSIFLGGTTSVVIPDQQLKSCHGGANVGLLRVTTKLAAPLPNLNDRLCDMTVEAEKCLNSSRIQVYPQRDSIQINIETVTLLLSQKRNNRKYFLHVSFLNFYEAITTYGSCDSDGVIQFRHDINFPILPQDGKNGQTKAGILKESITFTLFSDMDIVEHDKHDQFQFIGEGRICLEEISGNENGMTQITAASNDAHIVACINAKIHVPRKIVFPVDEEDRIGSAPTRFLSLLDNACSTLVNGDSNTKTNNNTNVIKLLSYICPPDGIKKTAESIRSLLDDGESIIDVISIPIEERRILPSELHRFSKSNYSMLPDDEIMDLFQYLSNRDGSLDIHHLRFFVASDTMKILMTACDEFRKRNINVLKDLRAMGTTSKGLLSFQSLLNYFEHVVNNLNDEGMSCLNSLLRE